MGCQPTLQQTLQNADPAGRIRLNTSGSLRDLDFIPNGPSDGLVVQLESEELRASDVLRYSTDEQIWVAELNWTEIEER